MQSQSQGSRAARHDTTRPSQWSRTPLREGVIEFRAGREPQLLLIEEVERTLHPNLARAERARAAVLAFSGNENVFTDLSCFLADLRHFADLAGLSWSELLTCSETEYECDGRRGPLCRHDATRYPDDEAST